MHYPSDIGSGYLSCGATNQVLGGPIDRILPCLRPNLDEFPPSYYFCFGNFCSLAGRDHDQIFTASAYDCPLAQA